MNNCLIYTEPVDSRLNIVTLFVTNGEKTFVQCLKQCLGVNSKHQYTFKLWIVLLVHSDWLLKLGIASAIYLQAKSVICMQNL